MTIYVTSSYTVSFFNFDFISLSHLSGLQSDKCQMTVATPQPRYGLPRIRAGEEQA
jgi:hypothetical protein